ncbi:MAG: LPXTG cell wall anchor domain-containing protein [Ilumatobacteraceae bacterium]
MTTHRTTTRTTRLRLAKQLGVALLSTVALGTVMAGTAAASDHEGHGELVATSTPPVPEPQPEPEPQPQSEIDDKDGPVECTPFDTNLVGWHFELDDDGTHVIVTISYADDVDTCANDLAVATWTLPSADVDRTDGGAQVLTIWEPSINDIEEAGSLTLPMQFLGCYNEVAILFGPTTIADEKFVDLCPVIDQPVDQPDADSGAGQPGGPELPRTGTASTVLAAIAGLLLAVGIALTGAGRRRQTH